MRRLLSVHEDMIGYLEEEKLDVLLIQEPYSYKGKIPKIANMRLFNDKKDNPAPRSCTLLQKSQQDGSTSKKPERNSTPRRKQCRPRFNI